MARNWKLGEAVVAIQTGSKEDKMDIGRRFPLFSMLAAQLNEAGIEILQCVPDYVTARKIESVLKGDAQDVEDGAPDDEQDEKPSKSAKEKPAKGKGKGKKAEAEEEDEDDTEDGDEYESKSAKELFDLCKEKGLKVKPKQDKSVYIEALKAAESESEDEDDWEEEDKPAKGKGKGKGKAKPKDDDDDWDI